MSGDAHAGHPQERAIVHFVNLKAVVFLTLPIGDQPSYRRFHHSPPVQPKNRCFDFAGHIEERPAPERQFLRKPARRETAFERDPGTRVGREPRFEARRVWRILFNQHGSGSDHNGLTYCTARANWRRRRHAGRPAAEESSGGAQALWRVTVFGHATSCRQANRGPVPFPPHNAAGLTFRISPTTVPSERGAAFRRSLAHSIRAFFARDMAALGICALQGIVQVKRHIGSVNPPGTPLCVRRPGWAGDCSLFRLRNRAE